MANWDAREKEMRVRRRYLHANPEFGFEEKDTASFVADRLRSFGVDEVVQGVGGTGVVGPSDAAQAIGVSRSVPIWTLCGSMRGAFTLTRRSGPA